MAQKKWFWATEKQRALTAARQRGDKCWRVRPRGSRATSYYVSEAIADDYQKEIAAGRMVFTEMEVGS